MKRCFPFHVNILTVFSFLIVIIVSALVVYGYRGNAASSLVAARQLLGRVGLSVSERTQSIFDTAFDTANIYVDFPGIAEKPSIHSHPMSRAFFRFLEGHPDFTSIYVAFDDGDFYLVSSLKGRDEMVRRLKVPADAVWYTQHIGHLEDGTRFEFKKYLDEGFVIVGSAASREAQFDPRRRGWFKDAEGGDTPLLSDIYTFTLSGDPGITVSRRFEGKVSGVFGLDISLAKLSGFVRSQTVGEHSEIVLFNSEGKLYAYSDPDRLLRGGASGGGTSGVLEVGEMGVPVLSSLMREFRAHGGGRMESGEMDVDGEPYLYEVEPLPAEYGKELYVAVTVPEKQFTGPIAAIGERTALVSLALLLLAMPVVYGVARLVSHPLILLTKSVDNIKAFNLRIPVGIDSFILEIRNLASALETMRRSLTAFGSYVPKPLVKRMITSGVSPALGGDRRELTLLFSDIEGFTSLSEGMSPEELTQDITEYFRRVSQLILRTNGTVDKYIGDAVMAFWNAPVRNANHAEDACLAALRCQAALRVFNRGRAASGKPQFRTRMGIHTGEAVVGNIGSADRMAYTAIGESVNLASRLEGLNKYLGTAILVSEATRRRAGDRFLFRQAGRVVAKGTTTGVGVFELLGTRHGATGVYAPLCADAGAEARVGEWDACFESFLARDFEGARRAFGAYIDRHGPDRAAEHFRSLAETFISHPPADGWDGEQVFDAK